MEQEYLGTTAAAKRLGVSPCTLRKYLREGTIPASDFVRYGSAGNYRISAAALDRLTAPAVPAPISDRRESCCRRAAAAALRVLGSN